MPRMSPCPGCPGHPRSVLEDAPDFPYCCPEHRERHRRERSDQDRWQRSQRPSSKLIHTKKWLHFREYLTACGNVICQHVGDGGVRCHRPVEFWHHILDKEEFPQFQLDQRNVVGVCREHHPNTPGDPGGIDYVPTLWSAPGEPAPKMISLPGERVPPGTELWNLANRKKLLVPPDAG